MPFRFNDIFQTIVTNDITSGAIPFFVGSPGIGKSCFTADLVETNLRTKCFTFAANQLADKADVTGARLIPTDDGEYAQVFYPHQVIQDAIRYAEENPTETPVLFIDEINRTTPDVTSELLSLPTLRAIGSKKLPDNLRIVCAGNDKGNVTSLDEASVTRFVIYFVEPDVDTFFRVNPDLNPFIKNVLSTNPSLLLCKTMPKAVASPASGDDSDDTQIYLEDMLDDDESLAQSTNPRTITKLSGWMNAFTDAQLHDMLSTQMPSADGDISTLLQECLIAHTGNTEFTLALMLEISSKINTVSNQANVTFTAPAIYQTLVAAPSVSDINQEVLTMSNRDKSGCLVAALADMGHDTRAIITSLAPTMQNLDPNDMVALVDMAKANKLSATNVASFRGSQTPISSALEAILAAFY